MRTFNNEFQTLAILLESDDNAPLDHQMPTIKKVFYTAGSACLRMFQPVFEEQNPVKAAAIYEMIKHDIREFNDREVTDEQKGKYTVFCAGMVSMGALCTAILEESKGGRLYLFGRLDGEISKFFLDIGEDCPTARPSFD